IAVCALALVGCASGDIEADAIEPPPTQGVFDYQLGGASDDAAGERIDVVVRDAAAEPLEGAYSVCYVNGFQTQPGDDAWDGRDDLLLLEGGEPVVDPDWPDERILDPSMPEQREGILEIVGPRHRGVRAGRVRRRRVRQPRHVDAVRRDRSRGRAGARAGVRRARTRGRPRRGAE